ncbi:Alpha/Beta hydrolase protein [Chlamydoabsidia padenii]|nr:Alpha/Beta hydrolase protein [Chlamydoabsidia padenii]
MSFPPHLIKHLGRIPFYHHKTSSTLTLCFIPGFRSSFQSSIKSTHLFQWAQQRNVDFLTWDHDDETSIQDWCQQGKAVITSQILCHSTHQRLLFVGASLGTWLALHIAHNLIHDNDDTANSVTIQGLIGIGGAVDTTEKWLQELGGGSTRSGHGLKGGMWRRPSEYTSQGYYDIPISFLEASRPALLLQNESSIESIPYPIHLIHGALDKDVSLVYVDQLLDWVRKRQASSTTTNLAHLHLIKDGDHRLSRPQDLCLLDHVLDTCTDGMVLGGSCEK